jgi:O-antigen/teichoic acid export membrane protein
MISGLLKHRLAKNAYWLMVGQGANFFLQAAYFILLARLLGVASYGIFAGAYALVNTVTPYSALGSSMLFMRYVSLDRSTANAHWGNTIATILCVSTLLALFLGLLSPSVLGPSRVGTVLILVVANCVMSQIVTCAGTVFLTLHQVKSAAFMRLLSNALRTATLFIMLATLKTASPFQWSLGVLISSAAAALVALIWVHRIVGRESVSLKKIKAHFWEGIGFSVAGSTESLYNDFDKIMLSHYHLNVASGFYTMAYRIVDFASTPINALVSAVMPRLFALSKDGFRAMMPFARKVIRIGVLIGFGCAISTFLSSRWIPYLAGKGFAEAVQAVRWLCWLPILRALHQLSGSVLTAGGIQTKRTLAQLAVSVFNIGINCWLIPTYGWIGAAWSSLASDGLLCILNLTLLAVYRHRATWISPEAIGDSTVNG